MLIWKEKKIFKTYSSLAKGVGLFVAIPRLKEFYVMTTSQEKSKMPKNAYFHPIQRYLLLQRETDDAFIWIH